MISIISIRAQVVVRVTAWAFIYVIEHTKTRGGGIKMYTFKGLKKYRLTVLCLLAPMIYVSP